MENVLRQVRSAFNPDVKLAIFWDNCKIHQATIVKETARSEDVNIELIWNCPYRPDLAGIEKLFAEAKRRYRRNLDQLKAHVRQFDPTGLV